MSEPRYLVDISVWARADIERVSERLEELALSGRLWTCRVVDLEHVYGCPKRRSRQR